MSISRGGDRQTVDARGAFHPGTALPIVGAWLGRNKSRQREEKTLGKCIQERFVHAEQFDQAKADLEG